MFQYKHLDCLSDTNNDFLVLHVVVKVQQLDP